MTPTREQVQQWRDAAARVPNSGLTRNGKIVALCDALLAAWHAVESYHWANNALLKTRDAAEARATRAEAERDALQIQMVELHPCPNCDGRGVINVGPAWQRGRCEACDGTGATS